MLCRCAYVYIYICMGKSGWNEVGSSRREVHKYPSVVAPPVSEIERSISGVDVIIYHKNK